MRTSTDGTNVTSRLRISHTPYSAMNLKNDSIAAPTSGKGDRERKNVMSISRMSPAGG
jgi:hypothetical protein